MKKPNGDRLTKAAAQGLRTVSNSQRLRELLSDPRSLAYAVLVHLVFLSILVFSFEWREDEPEPPKVNIVDATLVDESKVQAELEKLKKAEAEKKRREESRQQQLKKKADEAKKARLQEEKRLADLQKKKEAEQKKLKDEQAKREREAAQLAELEKKQQAEKARLAELEKQRQAEAEKLKKQQQEQQRLEAERALQEQLAAEQKQLEAEQQRQAQSVVNRYREIIRQQISRNWLQPAGSRSGLRCKVQINLIPGGEVANVTIAESSGDPLFDRSVENAVRKASPLPLPPDPALFDRYFRDMTLLFNPEE